MSASPDLIFQVDSDGIALVSLNRPERLNAVPANFHDTLFGTAMTIRDDPAIRAVVLTGEGRAFCAGADMTLLSTGGYGGSSGHIADRFPIEPQSRWPVGWFGMIIPKPVVCAVNGAAVGYGAELALTADMRIAGESARFGWVFAKLGIVTDMGVGPVVLPRLMPLSEAARLLYSGEIVGAQEALRLHLVSEVVPDAKLRERAFAMARHLAAGAPLPIALHKRQLLDSMLKNAHDVYFENLDDWGKTLATDDFREGARAFFEKRPAQWTGR